MKNLFRLLVGLFLLTQLGGCAAVVAGAAIGGVTGYELAKHGYKFRSPIVKSKNDPGKAAAANSQTHASTGADSNYSQPLPPPQPLSSTPVTN